MLVCALLVVFLAACSNAGDQEIPTGEPGPQGEKGERGEKGEKGDSGENGLTPYIGTNGNWWIGDSDTGVDANGNKGDKGDQGETGVKGEQGEPGTDGKTAEFRTQNGWLQWKYTDENDTEWKDLYEYGPTVNNVYFPVPDGVPSATVSTYSYTDNYGLAGTYTAMDDKEFAQGTTVSLTATVNEGYTFEGWYIENECISSELEYQYTVSSHNVDIEARYSCYTLTVISSTDEDGAAGTYTSVTNKKVIPGTKVELTATVNEGYNFDGWFIGDRLASNSLTYSYEMTDRNTTVEARYSSYTVTTSSENNVANVAGTYTSLYNKKVAVGSNVTLTATVNDGYNFEGWYIDDTCVSKELEYSYTMERANVEITARYSSYKINTIGISYNASWEADGAFDAGTYTNMSNTNVSAGESVTLTATVNEGYNFVGWFINDTCVETALEYTFTMGKENVEIEARYIYYRLTTTAKHAYSLYDATNDPGDQYEFDTPELYISTAQWDVKTLPGTSVTVTATEIEGYTFVGWRTWDSILSHEMNYTFTMPADDHTVFAIYREN